MYSPALQILLQNRHYIIATTSEGTIFWFLSVKILSQLSFLAHLYELYHISSWQS